MKARNGTVTLYDVGIEIGRPNMDLLKKIFVISYLL
jgi:hypothetical protein